MMPMPLYLRLIRRVTSQLVRLWLVRRTMRVVGTSLLTWFLCVLMNSVIGALNGDETAIGNIRTVKSQGMITFLTE